MTSKRTFCIIVICIMIMASLSSFAPIIAYENTEIACGESVTWKIDSEGVLTVSGSGEMWNSTNIQTVKPWESAEIPLKKVIVEEGVTSIGSFIFYSCQELESVVLPETITKIGQGAFKSCSKLSTVNIPDSVTKLATEAFYGTALKSINIPSGIETIEQYAFSNCNIETLNIPEGVRVIGEKAFELCKNLKEITFPSTLLSIENYAFEWCTGLTKIIIPDGVITLGEGAFFYCKNLTDVTLPDGIENFGTSNPYNTSYYTGIHAFYCSGYYNDENNWENGILYIDNYLIDVDTALSGEVSVKEGIKYITDMSFYRCKAITKVNLPESIEKICYGAFYNCTSLAEITSYDGIKSIGNEAFNTTAFYKNEDNWENGMLYMGSCLLKAGGNFSTITIKEGTVCIGDKAFDSLSSLSYIEIPESVKYIGNYAFYYCSMLDDITFPATLESIGEYAFQYCRQLKSVILPDTVTYIGKEAFKGCENLETLVLGKNITGINDYAFYGCGIKKLSIPDSVKYIGNSAFSSCNNMEELSLGNGVEEIGDWAFYCNEALEEVNIPDSVRKIGEYSFSDLKAKTITIGKGLQEIFRLGAFIRNFSLTEFWVSPENEYFSSIGGALFDKEGKKLIQYPLGSINTHYTVPDGTEEICVGALYCAENLSSLTFSDSVKYIGQEAVASCTELSEVNLGKSIETIGPYAFSYCSSLSEIVIPDSVKKIEDGAFAYNRELSYVELGENVSYIGKNAFAESYIGSIQFPDALKSIGEEAFRDCMGLEKVNIPASVLTIGLSAFENCTALEEINVKAENKNYCSLEGTLFTKDMKTIIQYAPGRIEEVYSVPESIENIADRAFYGARYIERIILPQGTLTIGDNAFAGCNSLGSLYIPESVIKTGKATFVDNCKNFGVIYYGGDETEWKKVDYYDKLLENNKITIAYNYKYFTENIRVFCDGVNTSLSIMPEEGFEDKRIVVASYCDGVMQEMEAPFYEEEPFVLSFSKKHDKLKILNWDDLSLVKPLSVLEFDSREWFPK